MVSNDIVFFINIMYMKIMHMLLSQKVSLSGIHSPFSDRVLYAPVRILLKSKNKKMIFRYGVIYYAATVIVNTTGIR